MERKPVTSSFIASIGHEGDVLEVEYKNGKVYRHEGVTAEQHAALVGADSVGKHYNDHIKGLGTGKRIGLETAGDQPF